MIESQKLGILLDQLEKSLDALQQKLQDMPVECKRAQAEAMRKAKDDFEDARQKKLEDVTALKASRLKLIEDTLDGFLHDAEDAGALPKQEILDLEKHLGEVYPPELINDYVCLNPLSFDSDEEALDSFRRVEHAVANLRRGSLAGTIFNGVSALLDKAADYPQLGLKVAGGMVVTFIVGMVFSPFLFIGGLSALGLVSGLQGYRVQRLLQKIYSVKLHFNYAYDEEKFFTEKQELMEMAGEFFDTAIEQATEIIEQEEFVLDPTLIPGIVKKFDDEIKVVQGKIDQLTKDKAEAEERLQALVLKIEELAAKEKATAETARKHYLGTITWEKKWLQGIFLDVSAENKVKMIPFGQGNGIYFSRSTDSLKQFSRLSIFQTLLHMHPDYACSVILDYKYNGGELTQFSNIPDRSCKICYTDDDITAQIENVNNKIRARTNNILSTCSSIEEFNELMAGYNSAGEYYVIVHVFGIDGLSSQFLSNIRNGPRVGYYFKFYWTVDEMTQLKDSIPFEEIEEIYEVKEFPMPRTPGAAKRLIGLNT